MSRSPSMVHTEEIAPGKVHVWRDLREGQTLCVEPAHEEILSNILVTSRWSANIADDGKVGARKTRQPLYEIRNEGETQLLTCWAGLAPVVRAALRASGLQPFGGLYHENLPLPAEKNGPLAWIDFIAHHDRGVIRYAKNAIDIADVIALIAIYWPDRRLAVVDIREKTVKELARRVQRRIHELQRLLRTPIEQAIRVAAYPDDPYPEVDASVAIATYLGLADAWVPPAEQHI